jgi:hypothetical protein
MTEIKRPLGVPFFTNDCPSAKWKRRARVMKANSEPDDTHPNGTLGVVIGSIGHPIHGVAYFVEWDTAAGIPALTAEKHLTAPQSRQQTGAKRSAKAKNTAGCVVRSEQQDHANDLGRKAQADLSDPRNQ